LKDDWELYVTLPPSAFMPLINGSGVSRMREWVRLSASSNALDELENKFSEPPSAFDFGVEQILVLGGLTW